MDKYSLLYSSAYRTGLLSGFQRLRSQKTMCDVILEAGGVSFPCHRALLASSSDYFWALFGENTAERIACSISLPVLTPAGLEAILDFLYSGWLSVSFSTLPDVIEAARYLQVETSLAICEQFMTDNLNLENCCCFANLAEHHVLLHAFQTANQTIATKMKDLLKKGKFNLLRLNFQSLMAVLEAEEIPGVKEMELARLTLDWLDENGPLPFLKSNLLLSRLRFGLISISELSDLSNAHRAMRTPLIRSQLTRAMEYHKMGSAQPITQSRQTTPRAAPNCVLLLGGGARADWPEQQVLAFDPKRTKFSTPSCILPQRIRNFCVCTVGNFLFVIGGEEVKLEDELEKKYVTPVTSNQVWRYDPRFDIWEPVEPMLQRRSNFTCCIVEDVIYVIGGRHSQPNSNTYTSLASVEFYDMAEGAWRRAVTMPQSIHGHASSVLDNTIYVSGGVPGGIHGNNPHENQDEQRGISKDFWSWDLKGRVWKKRAPMSIGRFNHRLAAAHGYIYALLGMYEPYCDIERYDPQSNHWTRLKPLLTGSSSYGIVTLASGNLLVFGGRRWSEGQELILRSVMEYDTKKDCWKEISKLPRPLTGIECILFPLLD